MDAKTQRRKVMADAEHWLVRLKAADCTAGERLGFQRWRAVPEHAAAFAATEELWQFIDGLKGNREFDALSQRILNETALSHGPRRHRMSWPAALAASIGLAVAGIVSFVAFHGWTPDVVYTTEAGERSTVKLDDGSQVILNSATRLQVRFSRDRRLFVLSQGEALFSVAQDPSRPFTVSASDSDVIALGTRFQVRTEPKHVIVTLLDGLIAVKREGAEESLQLKPGEQVNLSAESPGIARRTVDPEVVASWSTGRLLFRSTPLKDVVDEVNRYSALQIRIADPSLNGTPVSGTFEIGDGGSVLSSLQALFPIDARQKGNREFWLVRRR